MLVLSTALMALFYIKSVSPARLEIKIGEKAYKKCGLYRVIASIFELIVLITYFFYFYFPLPILIPQFFFWEYYISVILFCNASFFLYFLPLQLTSLVKAEAI